LPQNLIDEAYAQLWLKATYTCCFDTDGRLSDYPICSDTRSSPRMPPATHCRRRSIVELPSLSVYSEQHQSKLPIRCRRQSYQPEPERYTYMSIIAVTGNRLLTVQGLTAKTYSYDARGKLTSNGTAAFTWFIQSGLPGACRAVSAPIMVWVSEF